MPGSSRSKWRWRLGLGVVLFAICLVLGWLSSDRRQGVNPLALIYFLVTEDTRFSPGYSDKAFYSVNIGDTETSVTNLLGAPLAVWSNKPNVMWVFASGPMPVFESNGHLADPVDYTAFVFDAEGRLENVFGQVQGPKEVGVLSSSQTLMMGDGMNHLKLSNAEIDRLKGSEFSDIRASFGDPTAVRESTAVRVLRYSDSPSSGNYRLRTIGFDSGGKVVEINDDYYWD